MDRSLRLHVEPDFRDPILVLAFDGWNDAGGAATHAAQYLVEGLASAPLAEIDGEEYYDFTVRRPEVRVEGGERLIEWPVFPFRYADVGGRCELLTGIGTEPHLRWRRFCDDVEWLVERFAVRRVVLLGAYLADVLYSLPVQVTGYSSPPERMSELGLTASAYEGPTGIVGVLQERLTARGCDVASLWAGLPHYIHLSPNLRGSLALVQQVTRWVDLPVDQAPLQREAAEFETEVSKLVASDPALAEYVRELKKRGFAQ